MSSVEIKQQIHDLHDLVDQIKQKITDQEYLQITNHVHVLYKESHRRVVNTHLEPPSEADPMTEEEYEMLRDWPEVLHPHVSSSTSLNWCCIQ